MLQTVKQEEKILTPMPIYEMAMGFAYTRTLVAAQRLGIFESLNGGKKTARQIADERRLSLRGAAMLLDACVALKLCAKTDEDYVNTQLADAYLIRERPGYLGRFLDHFNDLMYPGWVHLEEAVRTGYAQVHKVVGETKDTFFQAIDRQMEQLRTFMETMEEHSLLEGEAAAAAYDFSRHKVLLDVGGGTGAMSVRLLQRYPALRAMIFDRPPVCAIAEESIRKHGLSDRIQTRGGDFLHDPLPQGADVVLLSAILHNWSPKDAQAILHQCHKAMPAGGTLVISDQVLNDDRTGPAGGLLCSLNMLVMMEGAQEYSQAELAGFLQATGFQMEGVRSTGGIRQLIIARRL